MALLFNTEGHIHGIPLPLVWKYIAAIEHGLEWRTLTGCGATTLCEIVALLERMHDACDCFVIKANIRHQQAIRAAAHYRHCDRVTTGTLLKRELYCMMDLGPYITSNDDAFVHFQRAILGPTHRLAFIKKN
jgi:hypothetical protein